MFTNRPYDEFSVVSTGPKCTLQASLEFRGSFPTSTISEVFSVRACLTTPFPSLPGYLGVKKLSITPGSDGSTVSYAYGTSSCRCVCVFDV